jgi:hypothetical protein
MRSLKANGQPYTPPHNDDTHKQVLMTDTTKTRCIFPPFYTRMP